LFVLFVISLRLIVAVTAAPPVDAVIDDKFFGLFFVTDDDKDEGEPFAVDVDLFVRIDGDNDSIFC
jgi:hypothetical protein